MSVLNQLYVRNATLPPETAIQFTDMGVLQISTNGMQGTSVNVGELWVAYDVEFIHEKLNPDIGEEYARLSLASPTSAFANFSSAIIQSNYSGLAANNGNLFLGSLPPGTY
jgi:hypothetical protein